MRNYTLRMSLLTFALLLLTYLLDQFVWESLDLRFGYGVVLFFSLITGITHCILLRLLHQQAQRFPLWYQLSVALKLLVYIAAVLAYVWCHKEQSVEFLIFYAACYLVFLVVETSSMSSIVRSHQHNETKP